jgi:hypothetical protein
MLTTKIEINGIPIVVIHAVRLRGEPGELCEYEIFKTRDSLYHKSDIIVLGKLEHYYDDGAEILVQKMLDLYMEKRGKTVKEK